MNNEILEITSSFVNSLNPVKIYLFGSFAYGTPNSNSDYDFYIIVDDSYSASDVTKLYDLAYASLPSGRTRPVDILVNTLSEFENKKDSWPIEYVVSKKGVLLYDSERRSVA